VPDGITGGETQTASLARAARQHGLAALVAGDRPKAIRWLQRAHRLVPSDPNVALALATACLGLDDARAAELFRDVLASTDVREARIGLASACHRAGNSEEAAKALAGALRRHTPVSSMEDTANAIVSASGSPGWCGLLGSGEIAIRTAPGIRAEAMLDGCPVLGKLPSKAWTVARHLTVMAGSRHLLGSPIDVAAIGRVAGCVEPRDGGIVGWAWHPGDPETCPALTVWDATGGVALKIAATDDDIAVAGDDGLSRPRGFRITASRLADKPGPFRITGRDGRDLLGSPIDSALLDRIAPTPIALSAPPREPQAPEAQRPADVVIPVHGDAAASLACLDSVLAGGIEPIVVDDASQDPALVAALDRLSQAGRIRLLRHVRPMGFPASANAGIAACPDRDVVLLNSDTLVAPGWLDRMRAAAYSAPDIGTVTPLSNNASILTYPVAGEGAAMPDLPGTIALDRMARRANGSDTVDIPVGVGFCLFIKRSCLNEVGLLRAEIFAQGYGEENDFCLRARSRGWRHVALPGVFVAHRGGASFGSAGRHLRLRNEPILNRLHPGYPDLIGAFLVADPLAEARKRLDLARWRTSGSRSGRSAILISHADGGGVEQQLHVAAQLCRAEGVRPIVLRPGRAGGAGDSVVIDDGAEGGFPNLRYRLPEDTAALLRLLRSSRPEWIEVHHLLNHPPAIYGAIHRLGIPYDVHIHDYAWICPRISLMGPEDRYCGEPDLAGCESCIARKGRLIGEEIGVRALRRRSAAFLSGARRVVAPSNDAAKRMRRYFPELSVSAAPHGGDSALPQMETPKRSARICIAGGIGPHKGYDILLACARDAASRCLNLEFVVVGDTTGDEALLATGRVFITGTYRPREAVDLIREQQASLGFVPSVWPETWSLTLTELWQAGLSVAAFDLGAPAERIRATGRGVVLPWGLPAAGINNALLAAIGHSGHE
jgi:GT2 family glycosyltransferase